jgi:iron(III) transport system substrate-binding protein
LRLAIALSLAASAGCLSRSESEVVVYTALDQEFSAPILLDFSEETGVRVLPKFDVESTKTVGLTNAIIGEARRPRCDVFWNNEIVNTLRLKERGLLDVYHSPVAESYPAVFRDRDGAWHGFAGRARILIVNTKVVPKTERPTSIYDLTDPKWKGKAGIAKPLFGTTATHAACLFAALGDEKARKFFMDLQENGVRVESGNKQVAESVARGVLAFGLTDTDDALVMIDRGEPVEIVYPDQAEGELGVLFIPNTLCVIKGCPHPEQARKLVDYLLQPAVETRLARGPSGQIPLNPEVEVELRVETPKTVRAMQVDFNAAVAKWKDAATFIRDQFATYGQ